MELGKNKLPIGSTYLGDPESALREIYTAFSVLVTEQALTPGFASLPASVAIARGRAVNISAGQLRLADASLSRPAIGICVKAAGIGQKAGIILGMGYASGLTGLTAGASVYLGNTGNLVFVKPGSGFIQGLGFTLSTTEMFVHVSAP